MLDFLLPSTDLGVAIQAVVAVVLLGSLGWATRSHRDFRIFVIGLSVLALAFFGVRAVH